MIECLKTPFELTVYLNFTIDLKGEGDNLLFESWNEFSKEINTKLDLADSINQKIMILTIKVDEDRNLTKKIVRFLKDKNYVSKFFQAVKIFWSELCGLFRDILKIILLIFLSIVFIVFKEPINWFLSIVKLIG